jgi:hypothetical protein
MRRDPIVMEEYFTPGFKAKPAVFNGSQTLKFWHDNAQEQAWEGVFLAGALKGDIAVVRDIDPFYIEYWQALMDNPFVINLKETNKGEFLTKVLLDNQKTLDLINAKVNPKSRLMVFFPTELEQKLADKLQIPLHGSVDISQKFGTKNGIRSLAKEIGLTMAPGFVCTTYKQIESAIDSLKEKFEEIVIKHEHSASGYFSKKLHSQKINNLQKHLDEIVGGEFIDAKDTVVIEGWLKSKSSLCAHIEILDDQIEPIICGGWQQVIDKDGISYLGGGPLNLSKKAFDSFYKQLYKLAKALKEKGAVGSFGPDFLVTSIDEKSFEPDTCILIELNARVPYTAFSLEIVKQIKGKIGSGFFAKHIKLSSPTTFKEIREVLKSKDLLITKKDSKSKGVVPYNIGMLPWGFFDFVAMGDSWEETFKIAQDIEEIFVAKA